MPGLETVDVGTDHGYLPAFLVLSGKVDTVLACDIGEAPLKNAEATVKQYHLEDRVILRLSDGLQNVKPEEARQVSICGMGGTLIARILEAAPWVKKPEMRLVLQPQSHFEDVRYWLCENGFTIEKEVCVTDGGRLYCCMSAVFTGQRTHPSPGFYYFGLIRGDTPEEKRYIQRQINHVLTRANALKKAERGPEEEAYLQQVIDDYRRNYENESDRNIQPHQ